MMKSIMGSLLAAIMFISIFPTYLFAEPFTQNGITVSCARTEETVEGTPITPVYMFITSTNSEGDLLKSAYTDMAETTKLYKFTRVLGVLKRNEVERIKIEGNETVSLEPGGYHILLTNPIEPLVANTSFKLWLDFENAGGFEIDVAVTPIDQDLPCAEVEADGTYPPVLPKGSY